MNKKSRCADIYNFIIIPYRDQYFIEQFGWTVRDLMIVKALSESDRIDKITVINRPVSIYERLTIKKRIKTDALDKINFIDTTSFDLIGPLKRRSWTEHCYKNIIKTTADNIKSTSSKKTIILDFTPIAKIDFSLFQNALIWYDLIDNFTKHNRFTQRQKQLVIEKYAYIEKNASLITGVTSAALKQFKRNDTLTVTNGLIINSKQQTHKTPSFAFGFVGFITDKLDVDFLINLARSSKEKIAIFGEVYDKKVASLLKKTEGIVLFGKFSENDLPEIMTQFEIGLIPYCKNKSHDGSPIKLYQYFNNGLPVITTQKYEDNLIQNKYVKFIKPEEYKKALQFLQEIRSEYNNDLFSFHNIIKSQIDESILWASKINIILDKLDKLQSSMK